jgi:pyruvate dehydrogenase E2 component (dihydrolipoamide acetyltransferase)
MALRDFRLPDLGEGLEEAVLVQWLVEEGEQVELNQPIAEIETAKATVEIPAPFAGGILTLHWPDGSTIPVGTKLVTFEIEDADEPAEAPSSRTSSPQARPDEIERIERGADVAVGYPAIRGGPPRTTPAVRKLAKELSVDLSRVIGSHPDGRITREDVEAAARGEGTATAWTVSVDTRAERLPLSPTRAAIARRLSEAAGVPQVTTFRTVDCTQLEELRAEIRSSPLPVLVCALAAVCADHPLLNASWAGDSILLHRRVNVGVAIDTELGVVVPPVKDAGDLGIGAIAGEIARLASNAREGTLTPLDLSGETIAVSNTGSYGSEYGTPLLNPGNAVTLALGAIEPRALVVDDEVVARPACTLSLTFDHRILDGADAGRALTDLVGLLEDGERLRGLPR